MRKALYICIVIILLGNLTQGQNVGLNSKLIKFKNKGFYTNYEEYIRDSPSLKYEFDVFHLSSDKFDTLRKEVQFKLKDSLIKMSSVWGFCDGESVYVCYPQGKIKGRRFWKIEGEEKITFFTYDLTPKSLEQKYLEELLLPPSALLVSSIIYDFKNPYGLCVINKQGRFKEATTKYMKKILKNQPDLLKSFEQASAGYQKYESLDYGGVFLRIYILSMFK